MQYTIWLVNGHGVHINRAQYERISAEIKESEDMESAFYSMRNTILITNYDGNDVYIWLAHITHIEPRGGIY